MAKIIQLKDKDGDVYPITQETVLYNSSSGTTGNITLSDNVSNYEYIEIFFQRKMAAGPQLFKSVKIYSPNGKIAQLDSVIWTGTIFQIASKTASINGTNITFGEEAICTVSTTSGTVYALVNLTPATYITRIVGYK